MKNSVPITPSRIALSLAALLVMSLLSACSTTDGPRLSGTGLGDTRVVSLGDIVTLRSPMTDDGRRQWQVTSFDSHFLTLVEGPRIEMNSAGHPEIVARARARNVGVTEVEITEVAPDAGSAARVVQFTVRINR